MTLGMISFVAFNMIDTYFVGQLGKDELAALSFTFPVIMVVFSITQGVGIGATALISKSIGSQKFDKAARETTDSLLLGLILVVFFSFIGYQSIDPIFSLLGAKPEILTHIREFMQVWYFTLMFVLIPFVGNSAMRAAGNTLIPSLIMVFAVIINAILDPILIFGLWGFPAMGIKGAALATAISRGTTMFLSIYLLNKKFGLIHWSIPKWQVLKGCWNAIMYIGIPSAIARMIEPLAAAVVTAMLASFGAEAVAAFGVGGRIEIVGMSILWALSASVAPFIGQNLGQNRYDRIKTSIRWSSTFSIIYGTVSFLLLFIFRKQIAPIFNDDDQVISYLILFLSMVPVVIGFQGVTLIINSSLNTLNKPWNALFMSFVQMFVIYVPLAWLGSTYFGVIGVYASVAISLSLGGIFAFIYHEWIFRKIQLSLKHSLVGS